MLGQEFLSKGEKKSMNYKCAAICTLNHNSNACSNKAERKWVEGVGGVALGL